MIFLFSLPSEEQGGFQQFSEVISKYSGYQDFSVLTSLLLSDRKN